MKTILRLAAAVAALAALACSTDDTIPEPVGPDNPGMTAPFTLTASFDEVPGTRVTMTDDGATKIELKWKEGDKIFVVNDANAGSTSAGTLYTFTVVSGSISQDGKIASFTCETFPQDATPAYAVHKGNSSAFSSSFNPASVSCYSSNYQSVSALPYYFPLCAWYDAATRRLAFKPLAAVLKLKVTLPAGVTGRVSKMRIGSLDGSKIFYADNYDITSGSIERSRTTMENRLKFSGSKQMAESTETVFYLPVKPGTELYGQPLEVDLVVGDKACSAAITGGVLEAGKCYPLTSGAAKWSGGPIYEGGTGSESDPYQIANQTNLRALARAVRAGLSYSGSFFKLTAPVAVTTSEAEPWLPIGTDDIRFQGSFDSNNQTVSGTIHLSDRNGLYLGFIGYSTNKISNVKLDGEVIFKGTTTSAISLGGIVGYSMGELSGCTHTGSLTAESEAATKLYASGIVGQADNNITACTQTGGTMTVNAPNTAVQSGGIAGDFTNSSAAMHTCRSESSMTVTGKTTDTYAGALVGWNGGTVYDCPTFLPSLTVTVNGTSQNPVKAIGFGYTGHTETTPCENASHTAQQ